MNEAAPYGARESTFPSMMPARTTAAEPHSLDELLARIVQITVRDSMKTELVAAMGIEPAGVVRNLLDLPSQICNVTREINEVGEKIRTGADRLKEDEIPLRLQANEEGKNEAARQLRFEELARANVSWMEDREEIAALEKEKASAEANRTYLSDLMRNTKAIAYLVAAMIGKGAQE